MVVSSVTQVFLFVSGLAVGVVATAALTVLVKHLALRWNLVDQPNNRSVHKKPIPRVGGVAIFGAFIVGLTYFYMLQTFVPGGLDRCHGRIPVSNPFPVHSGAGNVQ